MEQNMQPARARRRNVARPEEDMRILAALRQITGRGNNAEVRRRDGHLVVYEVKKQIAAE